MKIPMSGVERVGASPDQALAFVSDPNRVGRCMPDLEDLQVADARHFTATVKVGVGPVRGHLKMAVEITPDPAKSNELDLAVKGSGMGSGIDMTSHVRVAPADGGATELHWTADAAVSGPLASVGGRLLEAQAKKTTQNMFAAIRAALQTAGAAGG